MAKTVAELQEEAKKKLKDQNQKPNDQETISELKGKIAFLTAQTTALQEQSNKNLISEEEKKLAQEAEALKKNEEALKQEADLVQILDEALKTEPPAKDADEGEMSQKELAGVIAETVGKAMDASSKLTMGEVDKKLAESNKQLGAMQKVMVEFLSGMSVKNARDKYSDFDKYSEDAQKIHQAHPTLSPEASYQLAKAQKESAQPDKDKIETEKPSEPPQWSPDTPFSTSKSSDSSDEEHRPAGNPRQKFRQDLSSAIDDVLARREK